MKAFLLILIAGTIGTLCFFALDGNSGQRTALNDVRVIFESGN
jgi:hypothetical protein